MIASLAEILTACGLSSTATEAQLSIINMLHPMVEQTVKLHLQMDVEQGSKVEYFPKSDRSPDLDQIFAGDVQVRSSAVSIGPRARRRDIIQLKHLPVITTGLEVREETGAMFGQLSGSFGSDTVLTAGTDYYLDLQDATLSKTGHLYRVGGWPVEPGSVKVTYTGGWTRAQLDSGEASPIKMATIIAMAKAYKQARVTLQGSGAGPKIAESLGHYSYSTDSNIASMLAGLTTTLPQESINLLQPFKHYGRLLV